MVTAITDYFKPVMETKIETAAREQELPKMVDVEDNMTRLMMRSAGYREADFYVTPAGQVENPVVSPEEQTWK